MPQPRFLLACAVLALASLGAAGGAPVLVDVVYDPAAPLDPDRSYGCLADPQLGAASSATRTLACVERVPLAELCGTVGNGLPADCPFLPGSGGRGPKPTSAQIAELADALLAHYRGHAPKLNFAAERLARGPRAAYEANWQPRAATSPSIGAWNEASAAGREIVGTPLEVRDPSPADTRYGNTAWRNPAADPAEWNALMASATLDGIATAARNVLATPQVPDPSPAAVAALATAEVAKCRDESLELIRKDLESHLGRASGLAWARPGGSVGCLQNPGPPQQPTPPSTPTRPTPTTTTPPSTPTRPTPTTTTPPSTPTRPTPTTTTNPPATKRCWDGSVIPVSQSCSARPPTTYTACDGSTHASQADANAVTCTQRCSDGSEIPDWDTCPDDDDTTTTDTPNPTTPPTTTPPTTTPTTTTPPTTTTTPTPPTKEGPDCLLPGFCDTDPPDPPTTTTDDDVDDPGDDTTDDGGTTTTTTTETTTEHEACDGSMHGSAADAAAVDCKDPEYEACDGSIHSSAASAAAVDCTPEEYEDCNGDMHSSAASAAAVDCTPPPPPPPPPEYEDCNGDMHSSATSAAAVICEDPDPEPDPDADCALPGFCDTDPPDPPKRTWIYEDNNPYHQEGDDPCSDANADPEADECHE